MNDPYSPIRTMIPKGRLMMISDTGTPDDPRRAELFRLFSDNRDGSIEILISAYPESASLKEDFTTGLTVLGCTRFDFVELAADTVSEDSVYQRISDARTVIFADEHPELCTLLKDSPLLELLCHKYLLEEDFVLAGINRCAMWIPGIFMNGSGIDRGLGFINSCIVDAGFAGRARLKQLIRTVIAHNTCFGLGLSSGTAIIITEGSKVFCTGKGTVMLINARSVRKKIPVEPEEGISVFIENLKGHILVSGCMLDLATGEVTDTLSRPCGQTSVQSEG